VLLIALAALAGCATVGPDHAEPAPDAPAQWSGPSPHGGDLGQLGNWWQRFNDPLLVRLQQAAERDSPSLAAAWANVEASRATLRSAGASALPSVSAMGSVSRARQQGTPTATTRTGSVDASWELDLVGKVRRSVESAQAQVEARRGDWHDARITLAAEVASTYTEYRACGLLVDVYQQELVSIDQTLQATQSLVRAGLGPDTDAALAQATQASTTSALLGQRTQCELLAKSLSNLTGLADAELRPMLATGTANANPALPAAPSFAVDRVPADVLRQRPDVAARERDLATASAKVGVAVADLYPSLQLSGSVGVSAVGGSTFSLWSFGPSVSLPIFNGGARQAAVDAARASHELAYAQWRDAVRNAVTEVEKALVRLADANQRVVQADRAAQAYRRYLAGAEAEPRAGTVSLLTFEEARRQSLSAQLELIGLQRDQVTDWIALNKALGGGWDRASSTDITPPHSRIAAQVLK
jgi:NodT family efflux transporter outer membrane factor (OMF) lipoprotein